MPAPISAEVAPASGKDRFAKLNPKLPRRFRDAGSGHFLDPVDDREAQCAAAAVETAEQKHRRRLRNCCCRSFGDPGGALLHFKLDAADLGDARRVEQQDRAAVVGERRSGIETGCHHRRSAGFTTSSSWSWMRSTESA